MKACKLEFLILLAITCEASRLTQITNVTGGTVADEAIRRRNALTSI